MSQKNKPIRIDDLLPEHRLPPQRTSTEPDALRKLNLEIQAAIDAVIRENPTLGGSPLEAKKHRIVNELLAKYGRTLVDAERVGSPAELLAILDNPAHPLIDTHFARGAGLAKEDILKARYEWACEEAKELRLVDAPARFEGEDYANVLARFVAWLRAIQAGDGREQRESTDPVTIRVNVLQSALGGLYDRQWKAWRVDHKEAILTPNKMAKTIKINLAALTLADRNLVKAALARAITNDINHRERKGKTA